MSTSRRSSMSDLEQLEIAAQMMKTRARRLYSEAEELRRLAAAMLVVVARLRAAEATPASERKTA